MTADAPHSLWLRRATFQDSQFTGAILDFDDTLVATRVVRGTLLRQTLAEFGYTVDEFAIDRHWGRPLNDLLERLAPGIDLETFLPMYSKAMSLNPPIALPGGRRLLAYLSSEGIRVAIVSSSLSELVRQDLAALGLLNCVNEVWGCDARPFQKPDPRTLAPVMSYFERIGVAKEKLIYIGDSLADLQVARGNQIPFIAVTTGLHVPEQFLDLGMAPEAVVRTLEDLIVST